TGVQIVMGAGHYVATSHPLDMDTRTEDQIVEEVTRDVLHGCDGTTVRAGIIGEIGCSAPISANERKALRAAARAQQTTGAALLVHPGRAVTAPLEAMAVVTAAGGDPTRTIMSHLDRTLFEPADLLELARTGCYLEFDLFGQESSYYPLAPIDMPNDATRVDHLIRLIVAGYEERLLVAQDICRKTSLVAYGGDGYAHILENVVPLMRRKGMTDGQIDSILIHNPARILALTAGRP
ncbi:MAG: phosphotriesterase family protein, partial [Dehalococcoidia bacterium]